MKRMGSFSLSDWMTAVDDELMMSESIMKRWIKYYFNI